MYQTKDAMCLYRNIEAHLWNHCGEAISITYFECVSIALVIHFFNKWHNFWKKPYLRINCVSWFSLPLLSETCHPKKNSLIYHKCENVFAYKYPLFFSILLKWEFSQQIKKTQISNVTKICPLWNKSFHADEWTDIIKLTATLCNFAKCLQKNESDVSLTFLV